MGLPEYPRSFAEPQSLFGLFAPGLIIWSFSCRSREERFAIP